MDGGAGSTSERHPAADEAWPRIVSWTLDAEGGDALVYDAGGWTRWGIASRYHPGVDVRTLSREGAVAIYRREYWDALACPLLPAKLAALVFEFGVNPGQGRAARALQWALRVTVDGLLGRETVAAANRCDVDHVLARLAAERQKVHVERAQAIPANAKYLDGWLSRTNAFLLWLGSW